MILSKLWNKDTFLEVALPALTTMLGLQTLRVLLPSFVWYLGDSVGISYVMLGPIAIGTFLGAFLAAPFRGMLGHRRALIASAGGLGLLRLAEQISMTPSLDLAFAMLGTILFTFFFPIYLAHTRAIGGSAPRKFGRGFLLGFVFDTTIHGAFSTLDLSWQTGFLPLAIVLVVVAALWWLLVRLPAVDASETYSSLRGDLPLAALGPFVFLSLIILQNVARAATLTGFSPPAAFGFIMLANAIGLAAAMLQINPDRSTMFSALIATGFVAALAARPDPIPGEPDVLNFFSRLLLFPLATLSFIGLGARIERGGFWKTSVANGIGWLLFVVFMFIYYVSYDIRLGVPNTFMPPLAVILVGLAAIAAMRNIPPIPPASNWTLATIAFALLIVPLVMIANWREPLATTGKGFPIRVMTYNLHNGFNTAGRLDPEALAQTIEQAKPDIVGLQEVERGWAIDSSLDMIVWLSQRLKMPFIYGPTADPVWGNAILSRYPIREWGNVPLPPRDLLLKRGFLWARIDIGGGEELLSIATHYHHIEKDTAIRQQQSPEIVKFWNQRARTIFLGDLNAKPDAKEIAMLRDAGLKDAFAEIGRGDGFTFDSVEPYERIDYIWFSPDLKVSDLLIPRSTASDHLGIAVTVGQ